MKRTILKNLLVLLALIAGFVACEKDEASKERKLTPEEIEIIRIQDSLKNLIDADTFIIYAVVLPRDAADYRLVEIQHDSTRIAKSLGFSTPAALTTALGTVVDKAQTGNTVKWMAINASTRSDYLDLYTANGLGFWYDKNGDVVSWDDSETGTSVLFTEHDYTAWITYLGQFPDRLVTGDKHSLINVLENASGYRVALIFNVTVGEDYVEPPYEDPETPPTGSPVALDTTITVSHPYDSNWASNSSVNVRNIMRNAFKQTTYQIYQAIDEGTFVYKGINADESVYVDGDGNPASTANYPGHWFDIDGNVTTWGDTINKPAVYSEIGWTKESLNMNIGHHPDNITSGAVVSFKQKAELNGGSVTFTVNLTVE
ncbi:MAG: DUF4859 domain-containing protein [Bacteroidales bacterium]|nr:DUF4859 domain-containing protein [Bacteroidales bacterium]